MKDKKILDILVTARRNAEDKIGKMSKPEKAKLERQLDIEHAYYSSALEGSKLDRKTFDELAKRAA